jgi:hypothetical protein
VKNALAFAAALVVVSLPAPGSADVVTTKDGIVLEGSATKAGDGSVVVATEAGDVTLPAGSVKSIVPGEGPRSAARRASAALARSDAQGHYRLALSLEAEGLADLARCEHEAVLAVDPEHAGARRALGFERVGDRWLTTAEARRTSGLVLYEGRWVLPSEVQAKAAGPRQVKVRSVDLAAAMKTAATNRGALAEAARRRILEAPAAERVETATAFLVHRDARLRRWACDELKSLGDEASLRPLIAVGARDPEPEVRRAAVLAVAAFGRDDAAVPFIRALGSEHPSIVVASAQALATLNDPRSIRYLVTKITTHGGSPKSYFVQERMISYIQDFDVEVAQTSFIADPQIGIIQEGAVSAVHVLDAMIERTYVQKVAIDAFNSLASTQFQTANQVAAWFKEHGDALPRFGQKPVEPPPAAPTVGVESPK